MRKAIYVLVMLLLMLFPLLTTDADEIVRHNFYNQYDPTSNTFVYSNDGVTTTGDQIAVNTYTHKSIQISAHEVGEDIQIRIEGRSKDQINTSNWAVLDEVDMGVASGDTEKHRLIDVTEYVDFLRVGIRRTGGSTGVSAVDIEGLFTTLGR